MSTKNKYEHQYDCSRCYSEVAERSALEWMGLIYCKRCAPRNAKPPVEVRK